MKTIRKISAILVQYWASQLQTREIVLSSLAAFAAIYILVSLVHLASLSIATSLLVLASMGASTFLMFVVPHSPMSQPWPVIGGHVLSSLIGVSCAQHIPDPAMATATAVAVSILVMHVFKCMHPPSAATTMIAVLGGPTIHAMGWQFCYEIVVMNAGIMVMLSIVFNDVILRRRYPASHTHHTHHADFHKSVNQGYLELSEADFEWALRQLDGVVDISVEDLVDLYEFAAEHRLQKTTIVKH